MTEITMPSLSDSMQEGTILSWLKRDGDEVAAGDELVEIETDKATMTYDSPADGTLQVVAEVGQTLAVGEPIAQLTDGAATPAPDADADADAPAADADADAPEPPDAREAAAPEQPVEPAPTPATAGASSGNGAGPDSAGPADPADPASPAEPGVRATPLARRMAGVHGVDLAGLRGSGPRGRITRSDVAASAGIADAPPTTPSAPTSTEAAPTSTEAAREPASTPPGDGSQELTRTQQLIARRMSEAKATIPEFQVQTEVEIDDLMALRERLKHQADPPDPLPSLNDFIVKAAARALRRHPRANGSYRDGRFQLHEQVNVGVAVAADDALVVPTIREADGRSLGAIAREARRLAAAVRDRSITPPELSGATFTVSNLGMYGMTAITPVINPPQAAILGVGAARAVPALVDGELRERRLMTLTLSCDHRILYGADAAEFLSDIRRGLESPLTLVTG
ncbi:MAG: 2-oxo acid dehydrogenase subunit E2 [Solirubrobacterales bacterium]|nr:2-oxo acid dehydrogenase subunit E2 [Solirubrobacterales bacterium]